MKLLVTTHAQLFQTPDGLVWTKSVYDYNFFVRYLHVFESVRLVCRLKTVAYHDVEDFLLVSGEYLEIYPLPFYRGAWEYFKVYFLISDNLNNALIDCDCAILRIPDQVSFTLFRLLQKKRIVIGVEVVAHSWDIFSPGNIKSILRPFLRIYWDYMQKKICKEADGVSYVTKEYIQIRYDSKIKNNQKHRKITSYTSADIHQDFFSKPRNEDEFIKDGTLRLIHVSGINNFAKGHEEILKSLIILKEKQIPVSMVFVGDGVLQRHFMEQAEKLRLSKEIIFVGNVSDRHKLKKLLNNADIFIFPSRSEGLPRAIIEAMSTGLPCIASDVGGIKELLSKDLLLENPKSEHELVNNILKLYSNKKRLVNESKKNYLIAHTNYSEHIVKNKRDEFYKWLMLKATDGEY